MKTFETQTHALIYAAVCARTTHQPHYPVYRRGEQFVVYEPREQPPADGTLVGYSTEATKP